MFVSSEMPEVLGIADRVIVMCDGTVEAVSTPDELRASNAYYQMFSKSL